ncbi:MAG: metal ABC transporter permease [Bdellovibrionales bacterium]
MTIEWTILGPAFLAGLIVLATHVPLGVEVLRRGIIFIDLAVAQTAGLGALFAMLYGTGQAGYAHPFVVQACSLVAALLSAVLLNWTEKRFPDIQEALIGCLFVLAASLALLLLSRNPHGAEHMKDLLAGQILWVSMDELAAVASLYALVLVIWFVFRKEMGRGGFYAVFAVSVTASVQLVGVYLVFTSLIMPALAVFRHRGKNKLIWGYLTGAAGLAAGLILSSLFDLATGPAIVCMMALNSFLVLIIFEMARARKKNY